MLNSSNPFTINPEDIKLIASYRNSDNHDYKYRYPPTVSPQDQINIPPRDLMYAEALSVYGRGTMNSARDVIYTLENIKNQVQQGWSPAEYNIARAADFLTYRKMSDELCRNPAEMALLAAYRPDAVLWADDSVFTKGFVEQTMRHNPLVYGVLPRELQESQAVIDIYRDVLYKNGYVPNPELQDMVQRSHEIFEEYSEEEYSMTREEPLSPYVNRLLSPDCPSKLMFSAEAHKKMFTEVLFNPAEHKVRYDPHDMDYRTSRATDFLVLCESQIGMADQWRSNKVEAYNENKEALRTEAAKPENEYMRKCLGELCARLDLEPAPEWKAEFETQKAKVHHENAQTLEEIRNGLKNYSADCFIDSVVPAFNTIPVSLIEQYVNLPEFWTEIGQVLSEQDAIIQNPQSEERDRVSAQMTIDHIESWMARIPEHAKIALENVDIAREEGPVMTNDGLFFVD